MTADNSGAKAPVVSGTRVAWLGTRGTDGGFDYEVFTWTATGGVVQVTQNEVADEAVQVSADRLVWLSSGGTDNGSDDEIFTWTPEGGVQQVTADSWAQRAPQVSGDRLVWHGGGGAGDASDYEIFTWTPENGVVQLTDNTDYDDLPVVDGDRVVWQGEIPGDADELFTWTPVGGVERITYNSDQETNHQVSGDRVAWQVDAGGFDYEIFTWSPASGEKQLTENVGYDDLFPYVSGDRVVWYGEGGSDGGTDYEVFTWTVGGSVEQLTLNDGWDYEVRVSGDRLTWLGLGPDKGVDWEVYTWTPTAGTVQMTDNEWQEFDPRIDGDRLAWRGLGGSDGGNDYEVFTAAPPSTTDPGTLPPVSSDVTVSAEVPQGETVLTFSVTAGAAPSGGNVSDGSVTFGLLTPGVPKSASHFLAVTTNAANGYNVAAEQTRPLTAGSNVIPDVTGDDQTINETTAGPWVQSNTYGFGFTLTNTSGADAAFTTGYRQFADRSAGEAPQQVMVSASAVTSSEIELTYKLNISPGQPGGSYTNTITYTAMGNF